MLLSAASMPVVEGEVRLTVVVKRARLHEPIASIASCGLSRDAEGVAHVEDMELNDVAAEADVGLTEIVSPAMMPPESPAPVLSKVMSRASCASESLNMSRK